MSKTTGLKSVKRRGKVVAWFSGGVSSAVAIKLAIDTVDEVYFIDIDDHHPDTFRFVAECESWFDKEVVRLKSPLCSVENACMARNYVNGPAGAACTVVLKRRVRKEWERSQNLNLRYVWGMDADEVDRFNRLEGSMPKQEHVCPLFDHGVTKKHAHRMLKASGIVRPRMYELGYLNNNCIGCLKGGMGYWNKIRVDFPEVFWQRAKMERLIGASCINGVFLDELRPGRGRNQIPIVDECGAFCEFLDMNK